MTGYLSQKEMRFTVSPTWRGTQRASWELACLVSGYLFQARGSFHLSAPPSLGISLCLMAPEWLLPPPAVRTSLQAAEKGGWVSTALSVTFLKEHCPQCLQWVVCFPLIGQTMSHDHPRCKGDGKEFIDAFNKIRFPLVKSWRRSIYWMGIDTLSCLWRGVPVSCQRHIPNLSQVSNAVQWALRPAQLFVTPWTVGQ